MAETTQKTGSVRVRFAPSPTGYLHVGGARTALFNWLFARRHGGVMILRIEDTDAERNKPELVQGIIDGLKWLGVDWNEGPFYQSQRSELYRAAAKKCVANGSAFLCYCPADKYAGGDYAEPDQPAQDEEPKGGGPRRVTRCSCRGGKPSTPGVKPAIRFKVPTGGRTKFTDAVFGEREFSNDEIEDFVLLRSGKGDKEFGQSMYQLGAVVDDIDMRVTHVIRGADHISNTPKQVLLYGALGAPLPVFAHVPLILGADKSRLSKRHGATDVNMYRTEGFLPEAFRNFLALLGWSPGGDEEFIRTKDMIAKFSLEGVSRTNAVFDRPKLEWFNTQYLQRLPIEELLPEVENELKRSGLWKPEWAAGAAPGQDGRGHAWFSRTVDLLRPRIRLLPDFSTWARAFFSDEFSRDPAAKEKFWKDPKVPELLAKLADALGKLTEWNHDACDHATRAVAEAGGVKAGLLINATRVAIVGQAVAPPLFDTMVVLGQKRVVRRLQDPVVGFTTDAKQMIEGTAEALEEMLIPRVDISWIVNETDLEKVNEAVFELYKEAASVVNLAAHLQDDAALVEGGWQMNQAICAGLMIRISKFMLVVTQLSATRNRAEVVSALNRSIMESAVNLEFLVTKNDDKYFDQFVKLSLGPERELYDTIQANVATRRGRVTPIEQRMLKSINNVCKVSGMRIEEVNRKQTDWGGNLRERLKELHKEERYVAIQRIPSHAVHGTWVDLYMNHLEYNPKTSAFNPQPKFSSVDARYLGPIALQVLEATKPYIQRYFSAIPESRLPLERIDDLSTRILEADDAHEKLMSQKK